VVENEKDEEAIDVAVETLMQGQTDIYILMYKLRNDNRIQFGNHCE